MKNNIEKENNEMLRNQIKEAQHHSSELKAVVSTSTQVEPWVVAKMERATTDLSDIAHYLDGRKDMKMEQGGLTPSQEEKVGKVMHEFKEGKLHSGSKKGPVVTERKQAIAIALSEANAMKKMKQGGSVPTFKSRKLAELKEWKKEKLEDIKYMANRIGITNKNSSYITAEKKLDELIEDCTKIIKSGILKDREYFYRKTFNITTYKGTLETECYLTLDKEIAYTHPKFEKDFAEFNKKFPYSTESSFAKEFIGRLTIPILGYKLCDYTTLGFTIGSSVGGFRKNSFGQGGKMKRGGGVENVNTWEKGDITIVNGEYLKRAEVVPSYKDDRMRGEYFVVFRNQNGKIVSSKDNFNTHQSALEYAKKNVNTIEIDKSRYAGGGDIKNNVIFSINDDKLDTLLNDFHREELDYVDVKGDSYYKLNKRDFDRFIDSADSRGFNVDYENDEDSDVYVLEDDNYARGGTIKPGMMAWKGNKSYNVIRFDNEMKRWVLKSTTSGLEIMPKESELASFDFINAKMKNGGKFAGGSPIIPTSGTLISTDKNKKLDYQKNGSDFKFVVYDGEEHPVDGYERHKFKKQKGSEVTMNYDQFVNYIYTEGYMDNKDYNQMFEGGGHVEGDLTKLSNLEKYVNAHKAEIKANRKTYGFMSVAKITNPYDFSSLLGVDSRIFRNAEIPYYAKFVASLLK